ncbi:MAG: hypothetical protein FWF83_06805, partial [Clostridiales bacterium]|nr:hypothetical protein [Clostridiales bacterium]
MRTYHTDNLRKTLTLYISLMMIALMLTVLPMPVFAVDFPPPGGFGTPDINWKPGATTGGSGSGQQSRTDGTGEVPLLGETDGEWMYWHFMAPHDKDRLITVQ